PAGWPAGGCGWWPVRRLAGAVRLASGTVRPVRLAGRRTGSVRGPTGPAAAGVRTGAAVRRTPVRATATVWLRSAGRLGPGHARCWLTGHDDRSDDAGRPAAGQLGHASAGAHH